MDYEVTNKPVAVHTAHRLKMGTLRRRLSLVSRCLFSSDQLLDRVQGAFDGAATVQDFLAVPNMDGPGSIDVDDYDQRQLADESLAVETVADEVLTDDVSAEDKSVQDGANEQTADTDSIVLSKEVESLSHAISNRVIKSLVGARETTEHAVLTIGEQVSLLFDIARRNNVVATESLADVIGDQSDVDDANGETDQENSSITYLIQNQRNSIHGFIDKTKEFCGQQNLLASESRERFDQVETCVAKIERIARSSKILAINAQIESARLGSRGQAFSVVGEQMRHFSDEIKHANQAIEAAVASVAETMNQFRDGASLMEDDLVGFSDKLVGDVADVETKSNSLTESLTTTLCQINESNQELMQYSQKALSELQFQDPLTQNLMRTEHEVHKLHSLLTTGMCEDNELAEIDPRVGRDGRDERESGLVELF